MHARTGPQGRTARARSSEEDRTRGKQRLPKRVADQVRQDPATRCTRPVHAQLRSTGSKGRRRDAR